MDAMIRDLLGRVQCVSLANCEATNPKVRPMTLIFKDDRFFFATGKSDNKTAQLEQNPRAEFIYLIRKEDSTGYLRGSGTMLAVQELALRKEIADWAPFIYDYFRDPADPNYILFEFKPDRLTLMQPGEMYESEVQF